MGRTLTDGEVALVHAVFGYDFNISGELVNYNTTVAKDAGYTPNGVAQMGSNVYLKDYSTASADFKGFFLHEMTHAYMYQLTGKSQASIGSLFAQFDTDYSDKVIRGIPFSKWNIEEQANYVQDMYLRSQGHPRNGTSSIFDIFSQSKFKYKLTDKQFNSVDTGGLTVIHIMAPQCFPATTPIQTSPTQSKPISEIRVGDVVMAFDPAADQGRGAHSHGHSRNS